MAGGPDSNFVGIIRDALQADDPNVDKGGANYIEQIAPLMTSPDALYGSRGIAGAILNNLQGKVLPQGSAANVNPKNITPIPMHPSVSPNTRITDYKRNKSADIDTKVNPLLPPFLEQLLGHFEGGST